MANYSSLLAAVNAAITANGTGAITGPVLNTVLQQMIVSLGQGGYIFKGRAIPTTDPGSPDQNVFYIATTPGTYTNFSSIVVAAGECAILKGSGTSWSKEATGIDLVSVSQNSQTLEIGGEEVGALGGIYEENPEWVKVVTDNEDKILYGVKTDGKFYFSDGCPPQVQEYVQAQIDAIGIDALLATKVDKVTGKSLINADFASSQGAIENQEWLRAVTDSEGKVIEGIRTNGTKIIFIPIETQTEKQESINNPEWLRVLTDYEDKIIKGIRRDGTVIEFLPILFNIVEANKTRTKHLEITKESGKTFLKESLQIYDTNLFTAFDNLVCIGDSLTYSSVPLDMESSEHTYRQAFVPYPKVVSRLSGNIDFQILAVGGFTAKDCWDRFKDDIVVKTNPIAVVFLGSNGGLTDTLNTDVSGDDPDAWADNNIGCYCRIVNKLKTLGYKIILLRGWRSTTVSVQQTKSAVTHVAERFGCACMDAPYTSEPVYHKAIEAGYDYLHSNDLGYSWFAIKLIENLGYLPSSQKELLISNI